MISSRIDAYAGTGNALSIAANRISYLFDFRGPSIAIDTACSSSLVAVHLACCSLRNGESTLALAGGVNLILSPAITINFTKAGAMAPDGRCKAFDARANGYVRSEGAGVVVLKPLSRALADGDPIYAVIRGSAVNQDGRSNGLMAPNPLAQEAVLREAYRRAGVSPGKVQYVEAHGTGTFLGDPIEAKALGTVLARRPSPGATLRPGLGQNQPGPPRGRRRHRRLDQGGAGAQASGDPAEPALSGAQPAYSFRRAPSPSADDAGSMACGVGSSLGRGELIRFWWNQCPCGSGRSAPVRFTQCRMRNGKSAIRKSAHLLPLSARSPEALQSLARAYQNFLAAPESTVSLHDICYTRQRAAQSPRLPSRRDRQFAGATERGPGGFFAGRGSSRSVFRPQAFRSPEKTCFCVSGARVPMVWHGAKAFGAGSCLSGGRGTL